MKPKSFKSNTGGHVAIYLPGRGEPIHAYPDRETVTADPAEIEALRAADQVTEINARSGGR